MLPLEEFRNIAVEARPDLKAARKLSISGDRSQARGGQRVDGPTFGVDMGATLHSGYIGFSVTIPLRIFDKNQGEKQRTELDIRRNERLRRPPRRRCSATWIRPMRWSTAI